VDWKETAWELLTIFSLLAIIGTATVFLMVKLLNLIFGWFGVHRRPRGTHKLGRNDPCRCSSGQKYKRWCLPTDRQISLLQTWSASNRDPAVMGGAWLLRVDLVVGRPSHGLHVRSIEKAAVTPKDARKFDRCELDIESSCPRGKTIGSLFVRALAVHYTTRPKSGHSRFLLGLGLLDYWGIGVSRR
jgi:hypothetical protein